MALYSRRVVGGHSRVWRLLRGGALSVAGAVVVVWSQSGGTDSGGGNESWLFGAGVVAALACSCGPLAGAMGLAWAGERAAAAETDVWRYVAFWRVCSAVCGVSGSLTAHMWSGAPEAGVAPLAFLFC